MLPCSRDENHCFGAILVVFEPGDASRRHKIIMFFWVDQSGNYFARFDGKHGRSYINSSATNFYGCM